MMTCFQLLCGTLICSHFVGPAKSCCSRVLTPRLSLFRILRTVRIGRTRSGLMLHSQSHHEFIGRANLDLEGNKSRPVQVWPSGLNSATLVCKTFFRSVPIGNNSAPLARLMMIHLLQISLHSNIFAVFVLFHVPQKTENYAPWRDRTAYTFV